MDVVGDADEAKALRAGVVGYEGVDVRLISTGYRGLCGGDPKCGCGIDGEITVLSIGGGGETELPHRVADGAKRGGVRQRRVANLVAKPRDFLFRSRNGVVN